jgi:hypothetical protein
MSKDDRDDIEIDYEHLANFAAETASELITSAAECLLVLLEDKNGREPTEKEVLLKHSGLVSAYALIAYLDKTNQERLTLEDHRQRKLDRKLERFVVGIESIAASLARIAANAGSIHE